MTRVENYIDVSIELRGTITDPDVWNVIKNEVDLWNSKLADDGKFTVNAKWGEPYELLELLRDNNVMYVWEHGAEGDFEERYVWWDGKSEHRVEGNPNMISIDEVLWNWKEAPDVDHFLDWIKAKRTLKLHNLPPFKLDLPQIQMRLYSQEVWICATAYIKATSTEEAERRIRTSEQCEVILCSEQPDIQVSALRYDDPNLPDFSLSPSATIHWDRTEGIPEEVQ